jgi:hypothetical protein
MEKREDRAGARMEVLREGATMALYVSIVLMATLAALPKAGHGGGEIHGWRLAGIVWGTTLGLALAHWFSFRLAARLFATGRAHEIDFAVGAAQVVAALVVALLSTIPLVVRGDGSEIERAIWVPALIVGASGFAAARTQARSLGYSLLAGLLILCVGVAVAAAKNWLVGH